MLGFGGVMERKSFLFVLRHPFFLKNFAAILHCLADRGHGVTVMFTVDPENGVTGELDRVVAAENPAIKFETYEPSGGYWSRLYEHLAVVMDVFRYRDPAYDNARSLRDRAVSKGIRGRTRRTIARGVNLIARLFGDAFTARLLRWLIEGLPVTDPIVDRLNQGRYDVVAVSPLTPVGSEQALVLQAARRLRVRTVYSMYSWDNLTNKGLIRPRPDAGVVWNDMHVAEAERMHAMPTGSVAALGSPGYDIWFKQKPTVTREVFASRLGLDPTRPYILYTCSSVFVGGRNELAFVERFLDKIRRHADPAVASLGVLIRPHPQNVAQWAAADLSSFGNVAISPRGGEIPFAGSARADYYNAIFHCGVVVGINTSAMVEAAIIDRPVVVIADPSYTERQEGTLHFQHLKHYGFLQEAGNIAAAIDLVASLVFAASSARAVASERNRAFVGGYIRPRGLDQDAAALWADEYERQATLPAKGVAMKGVIQLAIGVAMMPVMYLLARIPEQPAKVAAKRKAKGAAHKAAAVALGRIKDRTTSSTKPGRIGKPEKAQKSDNGEKIAKVKKSTKNAAPNPLGGETSTAKLPKAERAKPPKYQRPPSAIAARQMQEDEDDLAGGGGLSPGVDSTLVSAKRFEQAALEGPFPLLRDLQGAFHESNAAADVLALGDSVHYRISVTDADTRNLPVMLADELKESLSVHPLHYSAFHPIIYDAFVEMSLKLRRPPRIVALPLNLRSFSPQWCDRPEYAYEDMLALLGSHTPGAPPPILKRDGDFDLTSYHNAAVAFDMSPLDCNAAFAVVTTAKKTATKNLDAWRARQLMIYHYTYRLTPEHKYVVGAARLVRRVQQAGSKAFVYLTPINTGFGVKVVGDAFRARVDENVEVIRAALEAAAPGVVFKNYSHALPSNDFFHPEEKTEHLNESGRMRLAHRLAEDLKLLA